MLGDRLAQKSKSDGGARGCKTGRGGEACAVVMNVAFPKYAGIGGFYFDACRSVYIPTYKHGSLPDRDFEICDMKVIHYFKITEVNGNTAGLESFNQKDHPLSHSSLAPSSPPTIFPSVIFMPVILNIPFAAKIFEAP